MITRFILDTFFLGAWHNYGHFTLGVISVGFLAMLMPLWAALMISLIITLTKEVADLYLDGHFNVIDAAYGVMGTFAATGIMILLG